ncbi:hypothetical protein IFM89_003910 [Coptis chinensis]|uniref:Uncharacterized protein n=1 Tax=Coptis chinensis TaxID=261450 RepID=A0A835IMK9_9MAGN|nr:hypothetical protein IFM89_003910 [Coptis chinensis]
MVPQVVGGVPRVLVRVGYSNTVDCLTAHSLVVEAKKQGFDRVDVEQEVQKLPRLPFANFNGVRVKIMKWGPSLVTIEPDSLDGHEIPESIIELGLIGDDQEDWVHCRMEVHAWGFNPSIGRLGWQIVIWDTDRVDVIESLKGAFTVSVVCEAVDGNFKWVFTDVYGSVAETDKEQFWQELNDIAGYWNLPRCASGDYNAVRYPTEKRGDHKWSRSVLPWDVITISLVSVGEVKGKGQNNEVVVGLHNVRLVAELRAGEDSDAESPRETSSEGSSVCDPEGQLDHGLEAMWNKQTQIELNRISVNDKVVTGSSSDDGEVCNPPGLLIFQYLERDPPYSREPLADKASFMSLKHTRVVIYCQQVGFQLHGTQYIGYPQPQVCSSFTNTNGAVDASVKLPLPVFGLASYKFKGSVWTPNGLDERQQASSLLQAAENWLRLLQIARVGFISANLASLQHLMSPISVSGPLMFPFSAAPLPPV